MDERWVGRGLALLGLVTCAATWLLVEDATDEDFRKLVGRHVDPLSEYGICYHALMPAWPDQGTHPLEFARRHHFGPWNVRFWADSNRTRSYDRMRTELCNPRLFSD